MDYNRAYKALYLYHIEERQSLNYISDETGLSPKQIRQLAKGSLYPTVYLHFMKDRETEDFSRGYPYKTRKIKDSNINPLLETCTKQILHLGADLRDVKGYLLDQDYHEGDIKTILKNLAQNYTKDIEEVKKDKIRQILNILKLPTKFGIDFKNNIVTLYPHPKLNNFYIPVGVEYKTYRSYKMPDDLFEDFCSNQDTKQPSTPKEKVNKEEWQLLYKKGIAISEIANRYSVCSRTVRRYLNNQVAKA